MAVWKIFINDVEQKYLSLNFERKLMINTPTEFEATIMYSNNIHIMDIVKITRNDIVEWKGYIEELNPKWDEDKHVLNISGRDATFILWKKWSDDFCNFAEKTSGFFGAINPLELVKFILNTPKTQIGLEYPYNKEGWGLDFSRSFTECNATRTSMGEPNWVITRKRGYGWYNSGKDMIEPMQHKTNSVTADTWTSWTPAHTHGWEIPQPPYLNDPSNLTYIHNVNDENAYDDVSDENVGNSSKAIEISFPAFSSTLNIVDGVSITLNYFTWNMSLPRPYHNERTHANFDVYIYKLSSDEWIKVREGVGYDAVIGQTNWKPLSIDISDYITTLSDANNVKIRLVNRTQYIFHGVFMTSHIGVSNVQLHVNGGIREASQINGEYFEVKFVPSRICAVYIESRGGKFLELDNKTIVPSHARNYSIKTYDSSTGKWVTLIPPVYDNKYPNIIHSFKPIFTDNLRITLEGDYSNNVPWGISQIYVYLADGLTPVMTGVDDKGVPIYTVKSDPENKYRILLHEGETDISTPPDTVPYVYTGGPYIKKILIEDEYTGEPIGPLNVGKQRVLEAVNYVMGLCSTDSELGYGSFTPYEWWIDMDDDNTFHVAKRKGVDKSDSIIFESGVNMGLCDYRVFVNDTVQRVYVVGQGEQKKLQDTSGMGKYFYVRRK